MTGTDPSPESTAGETPAPTSGDLERAILGEVPGLTADEVAKAAGLSLKDTSRLWRALGFADAGDEAAFTSADTLALARVTRVAHDAGLDFETTIRVTRAVGQTMARLADWEVATLTSSAAEFTPESVRLLTSLRPEFEQLLIYSWRRHAAAALARVQLESIDEEDHHVAAATVGFADLVGFTALTNELAEDAIGDLVEVFESRCRDVVTKNHGRVIKTLGDSVLFLTGSAEEGIDTALAIIEVIGGDERLPDVRLGLATGPVVLRMGDVYGPVVNLASRLTGVARRNRMIVDQATADLLSPEEFETRALSARPVRGFGDLEPVTVRRTR